MHPEITAACARLHVAELARDRHDAVAARRGASLRTGQSASTSGARLGDRATCPARLTPPETQRNRGVSSPMPVRCGRLPTRCVSPSSSCSAGTGR